jgi:NADH:ubiquinone reductase (H+-translocating)
MQANIPKTTLKRVVIVGGGFAGLRLASDLPKKVFQVVLLDKNNFHQFQPLLYQVATAGLEPSSIAFPFRKVFSRRKDFHIRLTEVISVDKELRKLKTTIGEISYDYLVLATGATSNFFGNRDIENFSLPMKSIQEALQLRNHLFQRFEDALIASNKEELSQFLNIVIVGGGPTGVEVSGTLAEMKKHILPKDFPDMDFSELHIYLIEGSDRLLPSMSADSSLQARKSLEKMGVEVMTQTLVEHYDGRYVTLNNGHQIPSKTMIWAAGVKGAIIDGVAGEQITHGQRLKVNEYNMVHGCEDVFAIGDVAHMATPDYPNGHPQLAQPAIQQGRLLARNLVRMQKGLPLLPFTYKDLGSMATIGRNKAVAELPGYHFHGFFAWVVWLVVHLKSILGVRNKFLVLINWIWNYITYDLSLRLIIKNDNKPDKQ